VICADERVFTTWFAKSLTPQNVRVQWRSEPLSLPTEMQEDVEQFWDSLPKEFIFNGALARLDEWLLSGDQLEILLRQSDYRTLLYSNHHVDKIRQRWGDRCLSRALGISAVLISSDGYLVFIKRSLAVGEFPGTLDVFGGHIDVPVNDGAPNIFTAMAQELQEEAGLAPNEYQLTLIGLIESTPNKKPELIFKAESSLTVQAIEAKVRRARDRREFVGIFTVPNELDQLRAILENEREKWSPSAFGSVCLHLAALHQKESIDKRNGCGNES
jgi:8-oxo-dGTP pyrophosphatase MutT (NUDIX family)